MKKFILIALVIIGVIYFFLPVCTPPSYTDNKDICTSIPRWKLLLSKKKKTIAYVINNKKYELFVASTPQEWERGLMYYRKLEDADGMMFIFPDKKVRSFWNKNTLMDLKLYWLNDNNIVGEDYLPSIEKSKEITIVSSPSEINRVIELVVKE